MNLHSLVTKVATTVAAATVLGGGTMVLKTATQAAVTDQRVSDFSDRLERIEGKVDQLLEHNIHVDKSNGK